MIKIKRVYDDISDKDGFRILVDRLWPRGLSKDSAHIDLWLKEIAPSDSLRTWFTHDPKKWPGFKRRYRKELDENKEIVSKIKVLAKEKKTVTLLYGAKDQEHNNAVFLQGYLEK